MTVDVFSAKKVERQVRIDPNATAVSSWKMASIEASLGIVSPSCDPILTYFCGY